MKTNDMKLKIKYNDMRNKKFNKRRLGYRLIGLPFVFALIFITHNLFVLKRTYHFIMYGGEYVNFEENERESILGIFEMLKEIRQNQKELLTREEL